MPYFIEHSKVLKRINNVFGTEIDAITLGPIILCNGKPSTVEKVHESIHSEQYLETCYIGFVCIYAYDYIKGRMSGLSPHDAYKNIRAEKEAYANENDKNYLKHRKRYNWL